MKTLKTIAIVALSTVLISSCGEKKSADTLKVSKELTDSASYAVGVSFGTMLKNANFKELNLAEVNKAIKDVISGSELKIDDMTANVVIQRYMTIKQEMIGEENKAKGAEFLEKNKQNDSVQVTASGLQYKVIVPGSDIKPVAEDTVSVYYRGTLIDGTEFDSSMGNPEPVRFPVNGVIPGWSEGIQLIGEGGKIRLYIPSDLAYGAQPAGPSITPNSTLIFDVDLVKVSKAQVKEEPKTK
mgnify:FL=1